MLIRSVLIAQGLEGVFLVFAHQDATTAYSCEFLFEDVGALTFLLATSHSLCCVTNSGLLEREGMAGKGAMIDHALIPWVELNIDFTHGLAGLLLEGAYFVAV